MHFLLSKLLELVRMEQEPLRVFPTAHFPWRWRNPMLSKKAAAARSSGAKRQLHLVKRKLV
ncbi:MAG: hypothetical protein DMF01_03275 [Verrucomicrobia bacterium]|nr:MAG: hypothetical protein DMF01_03275 [Verrucomicrobiota bacterium]